MKTVQSLGRRRLVRAMTVLVGLWASSFAWSAGAEPAPIDPDPLAGLALRAWLVPGEAPVRVESIRSEAGRLRARLTSGESVAARWADWYEAGDILPGGWRLIRVDPQSVVLLSPEGQVLRVRVSDGR